MMALSQENEKLLKDIGLVMDPIRDQVAVAKDTIHAGSRILVDDKTVEIKTAIKKGHRFAVKNIPAGEYVYQFGFPFGRSKGISMGEAITIDNIENALPDSSQKAFKAPQPTAFDEKYTKKTFLGYRRKDGRVGTRNYYAIIPTSMCASQTTQQIAADLEADKSIFAKYPNLDGFAPTPHTEGCGCDSTVSITRLMRVIESYVRHPNVGGVLLIDLGCEQTNYTKMNAHLAKTLEENLKPIDWITIEESGGVAATREKSKEIILSRLNEAATLKREPFSIEYLTVGTECGASDSFSGITANPVIGNVADKVIYAKGSAILSEVPEMVGTFDMLFPRFRSEHVAQKFQAVLKWYKDLAAKMGMTLESNLVPKNIEGGLINNYIKSLGAVLKGGTTPIEDVIDYAEPVKVRGLNIMQGPGSDLESVTGLVASGANIVCFSTGLGTPTGNAIVPVVKVATNSDMYRRLSSDMDFNAGRLLTDNVDINTLGDELLELVIKIASGQKSAAEKLGQRQFQIWTAGKLSL